MKGGLVKWNDHQMTHLTGSSQRISFQSIFKANISQTVETCIICTQSQLSGWLLELIMCIQIKIKCLLQLSSFNSCPLWINITRHQYNTAGNLILFHWDFCHCRHRIVQYFSLHLFAWLWSSALWPVENPIPRSLVQPHSTGPPLHCLLCNSFSCSPDGGRLLTGQCASPTHAASLPSGENPTSSDFEILEVFVLGNGRPLIAPQGTLTVKEYFYFAGFLTKDHTF